MKSKINLKKDKKQKQQQKQKMKINYSSSYHASYDSKQLLLLLLTFNLFTIKHIGDNLSFSNKAIHFAKIISLFSRLIKFKFKACVHYFSLFLKEQHVSWLFRTKYFEIKFNLQLLYLPIVSRAFILS